MSKILNRTQRRAVRNAFAMYYLTQSGIAAVVPDADAPSTEERDQSVYVAMKRAFPKLPEMSDELRAEFAELAAEAQPAPAKTLMKNAAYSAAKGLLIVTAVVAGVIIGARAVAARV